MQQQFARARRVRDDASTGVQRREMRAEQAGLAVLDEHVALGDLRLAGAQAFTSQPCSASPASNLSSMK